jgi:hypothetical protein
MGKSTIAGGAVVGSIVDTVVPLTPGATPALDAALGGVFTLTPGEDETITTSGGINGERVTLVVTTTGTTSRTLTFGTGFKTTGTLATGTTSGKVFVIAFVVIAGLLVEVARTTAM